VVGGVPKHHSGEDNHPPKLVVIHSAVVPCRPGMARRLGAWNATGLTGGSWHYATDPVEAVQCSYDRYVCWHAPPNPNTLGIEMADTPVPTPGERPPRWWRSWRWADANHRAMLHVTAKLTAGLLLGYGLPLEYRTAAEVAKGAQGWTTHAQVTMAYHQSTHWDPGWWPRRRFGRLVKRYADELAGEVIFAS
jgi:hypothetical protein